jgi:hypothetical protein
VDRRGEGASHGSSGDGTSGPAANQLRGSAAEATRIGAGRLPTLPSGSRRRWRQVVPEQVRAGGFPSVVLEAMP